jgi:hypothetical protein
MPSSSEKVVQLRQLLAERFGQASLPRDESYCTGLAALDEIGVPKAAVSEIVSSVTSGPGGSLLLLALLHAAIQKGERVILIDGKDAFSPKGLPAAHCKRLLWVRCLGAWEAMKASDLAIRDGNVPLVVLLLTLNSISELRRIPTTAWHRLQMLAEKSAATVLVFSPHAQVVCAKLRVSVGGAFPLDKLHRCRKQLMPILSLEVQRRRVAGERRWGDDEEIRRPLCA